MNLRRELENLQRAALTKRCGAPPAIRRALLAEVGRGAAQDPAGTVGAMMRRLGITSGTRL